ncbi:MAG TPA: hypothetical protein VI911_09900 [Patescibacteria group bacterium]|nr:hypothetical protein [Patescibacteria group bacterium]
MLVELGDLQETLISLIGYDSNSFDDIIDISGQVGILDESIDASGFAFINSRLFQEEQYSLFYKNSLIMYHSRRSLND